jgi:MoxR-like ATPase
VPGGIDITRDGQNPIEYEGTYPLPESQLDRFIIRQSLGYPAREQERIVVEQQSRSNPLQNLEPVVTPEELMAVQQTVKTVHVSDPAREYLLDIVEATRTHRDLYLGASPRGSIALYRAAQALAVIRGNEFVLPDHIKLLAPKVLGHRIIVRPEARISGITPEQILADIVETVPVDVI